MTEKGYINSAAGMIAAIREIGLVPLFKSPVSGWSIEELTHPDWWFYTSDKLGNTSQEEPPSPLGICTGIS